MNTKYLTFLAAAFTTFTVQCMNENKQLTIQKLKQNHDQLHKILSLPAKDFLRTPHFFTYGDICWLQMAYNIYGTHEYRKKAVIPILLSIEELKKISKLKNTQICGYSALGVATLDYPDKPRYAKKKFIQTLLAAEYKPTANDRDLARLEFYELCEQQIPKIKLLEHFLYNNDISEFPNIPQDLIHYVALLTFNLEEPLF